MEEIQLTLKINGEAQRVGVQPAESLNFTLRERLGMTGTKKGCDTGGCGTCTVIIDGSSRYSCMTYTATLDGASIETIEGMAASDGALSKIQEAFVKEGGLQCGYCTPGFILSVKALLDKNPTPSDDEIKEALIGNICRCTGYTRILTSVRSVTREKANKMQ